MYHQLSRLSGRLVSATHLQAPLYPVAPLALQRVEVPTIVHTATQMSTVTASAAPTGKRRLVPGTNIPFPPVPEQIVKNQEKFGKDDGVPVFLKGGPFDVFLYRLTMGLCILGLVGVGDLIYTLGFKKK